jgi:hypothetical protein
VQEVDGEVQSLYREFQSEKEDLLDSIRLLGHQVLLKDAIIAAFIPQVGDTRPTGGGVMTATSWQLDKLADTALTIQHVVVCWGMQSQHIGACHKSSIEY